MKKIILSVLLMSLFSMNVFAGDVEQAMNSVSFLSIGFPGAPRNKQNVPTNILDFATGEDFVNHWRNTINPENNLPYVEGVVRGLIRDSNGAPVALNSQFAELNIQPDEGFTIMFEYGLVQPQVVSDIDEQVAG